MPRKFKSRDDIRAYIKETLGEQAKAEAEAIKKQAEAEAKAQSDEYAKDLFHNSVSDKYSNETKHLVEGDVAKGRGLKLGRLIRNAALARHSNVSVEAMAKDRGDDWMVRDLERAKAQAKALGTNVASAGGLIVPDEYRNEIIELLRSQVVVRAAGARQMPMRTGSMSIPRQTAAATAAYVGENTNMTSSQQTLDQIQLVGKKLAALTPISNDLLRESDPAADMFVRDDLARVMALRQDLAFLRGDGTQFTPKGIRNWVASGNVFARTQAGASSTAAEISGDLYRAVREVEETNVALTSGAWFFTTRTKVHLMSLRDGNNNLIFGNEMRGGTLLGYPFYVSNQIPSNLGGGDESEVYFVEMSECLIGDTLDMQLEVFPGGAYHDGSNVISGVSQDQTIVRAISKHDFALRHDGSAAVITTVDWGA